MKILAVRLKNLTSIEGSVEIDFTAEPLRSSGIFAISGPTGAGKSTILDAMCLALYDKAPRFAASVENVNLVDVGVNQVNQSDVRNLLRRGATDGYAEVDFLGVDEHRYRSRWSVRRTRYKIEGSLQPQVLEVKDLDADKEFQGTKKELLNQLVETIGLTYEQFTRTVLLAQNDFATFLKSKGAVKAELLEKLTGTGIYSRISQEVFLKNKSMQEEVTLIQNKINVIEVLPEETCLKMLEEKEQLLIERTKGIEQLADFNAQLNFVRSLNLQEKLWETKKKEERELVDKNKHLCDALSIQEEGLAHFKAQWEAIQPDLKKARELDVQIQSQQVAHQQAQEIYVATCSQVSEQEKRVGRITNELNQSYNSLNRLLNRMDASPLDLEQTETILQERETVLKQQTIQHENYKVKLDSFGYLALVEEQSKLQQELSRLQMIKKVSETQKQAKIEIAKLEKEIATCAREFAQQEAVVKQLQKLYDHARMAMGKDVSTLRQHLQDGEACPVCGSTVHPYHDGHQVVDVLFQKMEQEYNSAMTLYQQLNNRNVALTRDLKYQKKIEADMQEQLFNLLQQGDPAWLEEVSIQNRLLELAERILSYRNLYTEWQKEDDEIKSLRNYCEVLRENVGQCRLITQKILGAREQLTILQKAASNEKQRFEMVDKSLIALKQQRSGLLKGKSADEAEKAVMRREEELNLALDRVRKEMEVGDKLLSGVQGELKQLEATLDELRKQYNKIEKPDQLSLMIATQQEKNLGVERAISLIETRLLQQDKNKDAISLLTNELRERQVDAEQWAKLNKLIGSADGSKFKIIAQSYTLNLLLLHANQHLTYLSRRYKLQQVPGTLALQVVDCDMCDEVRTVYSLSGGESFLISLALALGLSSLSSNNLKVESLFIDEGFGSLDAASLRTAMEALEQLQMQGRKIGVISHVQEMSERITIQVQVHKKVNGKSAISIVG